MASRSSRRPRSMHKHTAPKAEGLPPWLMLGGLLLGLLALLASESPALANPTRLLLIQLGSAGALLLFAFCGVFQQGLGAELRKPFNLLIGTFLLWTVGNTMLAPYRSFAVIELFRVLDGIVIYLIAAYGLWRVKQAQQALLGLVLMVACLCFYDFMKVGESGIGLRNNIFGTHENYGSLVMLLLPIPLVCALSHEVSERLRTTSFILIPVLGGALLISLTRSAWVGGAAAFITLLLLTLKYSPRIPERAHGPAARRLSARIVGSPILMLLLGFASLVAFGGFATILSARTSTLTKVLDDSSFSVRLHLWSSASRMASEKPVQGWGPGTSLVQQGRWTHRGDEVALVLTNGTGHQNIFHNFYVHWAADAGGVGLTLYVGVIALFLIQALRTLPHLRGEPQQRVLLIGCIATVVGASVDAISAPSYNFHGVSCVLWFFLGIGTNLLRTTPLDPAFKASPRTLIGALGIGVLVTALTLAPGFWIRSQGRTRPLGTFRLTASPSGNVAPGTNVVWTASFVDENGKEKPTFPGVGWVVKAQDKTLSALKGGMALPKGAEAKKEGANKEEPIYSARLLLAMPKATDRITASATYYDDYSRLYKASASVNLLDTVGK